MHCRLFSFFFHYFFKYLQYVTVADFIGYKVITIAGKALKDFKAALCRTFEVKRSTLIDTLNRIET